MTNHEVRWLGACPRCEKKDFIVASDSKNKKRFYYGDVVFCNTCGLTGHTFPFKNETRVNWKDFEVVNE